MLKFNVVFAAMLALVVCGCATHRKFGKYPEYYERGAYISPFEQEYRVRASDSDAFVELAYSHYDKKNVAEAFQFFLRSAKKNNGYAQFASAYMLSTGIGTDKSMEKARYWYELSATEGNCYAQYNLGYILSEGYKLHLEFPSKEKGVDISVHGFQALFKGDPVKQNFAEAEKWYLMAVEKDFYPAMNKLAFLWACQDIKLDQAETYAKKALSVNPSSPEIIDTYGWVLHKQGRHQEALAQLEAALKLQPEEPVIKDHIGDVHHAMGNLELALQVWKSAKTKDPALRESLKGKIERTKKEIEEKKARPE